MRKKHFIFLTIGFIVLYGCILQDNSDKPETGNRGYIVSAGETAPDFEIFYLDGTSEKLRNLRGNVVMLQFTASWCGVCRKEMPYIEQEIWQVHKNKDFKLIGIDRGEPKVKVRRFAEQMNITYPLALDTDSEIFQLYAHKKAGVTRNIIIDRKGKIVFLTRLFDRQEFNRMKSVIDSLLIH